MTENKRNKNVRRRNQRSSPNKNRRPEKDKFEWKKASKTLTFWILIILGSIVISQLYTGQNQRRVEIPYTEFIVLVETDQVAEGVVVEKEFHGTLRDDAMRQLPGGGKYFVTILPYVDSSMIEKWDQHDIKYRFKEKSTNWLGYLLTSILPWIILIGIWILLMRRMQGGGTKGIFSFGKSKAKLLTENKPKITFKDVAGADEAKEEVQEIIEFLKDPKRFQRLGGRIPRGALLLGPPGTGKTLLAKAIAGEAGVPFFSMSGADFVEMFVGVGAARVRDLFEQGKKNAPCIIFIDEIDAVGRQRGAGLGGGHDEREQTLNQLLVEMDGFDSNEGVILVAATNRPDVLDPALLRPGRFDRQIVVDRPDVRGREGILKVHCRNIPLDSDVDLETIAKSTPGVSGADLENIVNEAALIAAKRDANAVGMQDFEAAKDKVMMGMERKSLIISDTEKKNTAYHEAGHVLVAKLTPGADPVHKVTIIPRGRALGLTHMLPIDEKHNYSRSYLDAMLTHLLGGRVAEKVVLDEYTTGAGNDIERATQIARKMVCEWGMSEKLGPLTFGKKEEEIFLGREIARHRDYSEKTAIEIDAEVKNIIQSAQQRAEELIRKNIDKLHALANALLDREILDGHQIDLIIQGKKLPEQKPAVKKRRRRSRKTSNKRTILKKESKTQETTKPTTKPRKSPRRSRTFRTQIIENDEHKVEDQSVKDEAGDIKTEEMSLFRSAKERATKKADEVEQAKLDSREAVEDDDSMNDDKTGDTEIRSKKKDDSSTKTPSYIRRKAAQQRTNARKSNKSDNDKKNNSNIQ